jgi:Ca-activated chloride channel homolog
MEALADHGNGNYYYIDNLNEGEKVLSTELGSTLFTIAKDVKIQVAFNTVQVKTYRLIGYENRMLSRQDFMDDTKDAGEIGAGHNVTALYEVELRDNKQEDGKILDEKIMTIQLRYKEPASDASLFVEQPLNNAISGSASDDFRFSAAVASFGMLLRNSEYRGNSTYESVLELARNANGVDKEGYRAEFIKLVEATREIKAL